MARKKAYFKRPEIWPKNRPHTKLCFNWNCILSLSLSTRIRLASVLKGFKSPKRVQIIQIDQKSKLQRIGKKAPKWSKYQSVFQLKRYSQLYWARAVKCRLIGNFPMFIHEFGPYLDLQRCNLEICTEKTDWPW